MSYDKEHQSHGYKNNTIMGLLHNERNDYKGNALLVAKTKGFGRYANSSDIFYPRNYTR